MAWPGTCQKTRQIAPLISFLARAIPIDRADSTKTFSSVQNVQFRSKRSVPLSPGLRVSVSPCLLISGCPPAEWQKWQELAHRLTNYCFLLFAETLPIPCLPLSLSPPLRVPASPPRIACPRSNGPHAFGKTPRKRSVAADSCMAVCFCIPHDGSQSHMLRCSREPAKAIDPRPLGLHQRHLAVPLVHAP
jgi:hypothetical protein